MEALTIHPQNREQLEAIKSVLKALKIPFNKNKSPYDPIFIEKIKQAEQYDDNDTIILSNEKDIDNYFKNIEADVQD
jgi:hypothetical protein